MVKKILATQSIAFLLLLIFLRVETAQATIKTATAQSGNWALVSWTNSGGLPWTPTPPDAGDTVFVINSTLTVTTNTNILGPITIMTNSVVTIQNSPGASLSFNGDLNITGNSSLANNGRLDLVGPANFNLGSNCTYTHNPYANIAADESVFELGLENFSPTSTLIIQKWASAAQPLVGPTRVNGPLANDVVIGNLITSVGGTPWEQKGRFAASGLTPLPNNVIKGKLTVLNGVLRMNDGSVATPTLRLQDVLIKGSSAIIFQEGNNNPFTLYTNNFTDSSTLSSQPTIITNASIGLVAWNVTGSFITTHDFIAAYDSTFPVRTASAAAITITGDMLISGSGNKFDLIRQLNQSLNLTVGGTTSISGTPGWVRFIDSGNGNLNYTTGSLTIAGGLKNTMLGGNEFLDAALAPLFPLPTGTATVNILNDFTISGATNTTVTLSTIDVNKTRVRVGGNYLSSIATANLIIAKSIGPATLSVANNLTMNGGNLDIQNYASSNALDSIEVGNNFTFNSATSSNYFRGNCGAGNTVFIASSNFILTNSGTATTAGFSGNYLGNGDLNFYVGSDFTQNGGAFYGINEGNGNLTFQVAGTLNQSAGYFKGTHNLSSVAAGTNSFSLGALNFQGGNFAQYNAANGNVTLAVTNDFIVNYAAVSDIVTLVPYFNSSSSNSSLLTATIGGSMVFSGANGTFYSSVSQGNETIDITGNLSFNNGTNSFNIYPSAVINSYHNVALTVGGNINCTNGNNFLSAGRGDISVTVNGNLNVSGGTLSLKGNSPNNPIDMFVKGGYTQTNGTFYFHNNTSLTSAATNVTINSDDDATGNFVQSGGTLNMDNNLSSGTDKRLYIKSPNYTIGPAGVIMRIGVGTINARGTIDFNRNGTTIFSRTTGHNVSHITTEILGGTTLDVTTGDIQIGSFIPEWLTPIPQRLPMLDIKSNGILILRNNSQVFSAANDPASYVVVNNSARVRLQHTNGLYTSNTNAAFSSVGNLDFILFASSTIEYFGATNQIISGIGVGNAVGGNQKYGILEINQTGPITNYVYPTSVGTVNVRNTLKLTRGQLKLSDPTGVVGYPIYLESNAPTNLTYVPNRSYIKAETTDGQSMLKWTIGTNHLAHVIPFALDTTVANQIPVTFTCTTDTAGVVSVSTYHCSAANLPYPPGVGHVNSISAGTDNSAQCADRFWKINKTGTSANFSVTLVATAAEIGTVTPAPSQFRAQHYNYNGGFWDNPFQGAQSYTAAARSVTASTIGNLNDWWVLVNQATPLPVELLSFTASCNGKNNKLQWATASELNNDFFDIERSLNGNEFTKWMQVKGSGTTNVQTNYEITDDSKNTSVAYYKLKQIDFDGKVTELKTVHALNCDGEVFTVLSVFSTPEQINSIVSSPENISAVLSIIDVSGKQVLSTPISVKTGVSTFEIPSSLANGVYYLQVSDGVNYISGKKFMQNR